VQATTPAARRPVRLVLALALALACAGALVGAAAAAAPSAPAQAAAATRLELTPARAVAQVKEPIQYTAEGVDRRGGRSDLTAETTFSFEDAYGRPAPCSEAVEPDKAGQVTCDKPGLFFVTGDVDFPRPASDRVELEVVLEPVPPGIESVDPKLTPPGRNVTVTGTTGTCSSTGDLRLEGAKSPVRVAGKFEAKVPIPPGTFPGDDHKLLLRVRCGEDPQEVGVGIVVENKPPTPANDHAHTLPGEKVAIPVTDNDKDPDDPDGYDTEVREVTPGPSRGQIAVDGKRIVYTPGEEFDRRGDQFDYAYCDVTGDDGQRACGTATVFVARTLPEPKDDPGITTERNVEVVIPVTGNDKFPDNDALHVSRPPKAPGAEAVVDSRHPGSITYKPAKDVTGDDTFEYDYCPVVIGVAASSTCASATVSVTVVEQQVDPRIDSVEPDPSPPNRAVVVEGTTGTCDQAAELTLSSAPTAATPVPVTGGQDGGFEAKLEIPAGTFVGPHVLNLHAVCSGTEKAVEHGLTVENRRPDAVNDQVVIDATAGQPTNLRVLGNDRDPDDPDGYETRATVERGPAHGTAVARDDDTVDYTPGGKFVDVGQDRFTYRSCEVVGADGRADCDPDTATVTVTKKPPEAVDDPGIVTVQGEPIAIKVMANDRNAGEVDIPKLRVRSDPKPKGEPLLQDDGTIEYQPEPGSTGVDSFQYDYCGGPIVINAAQDCRPATVTVDVRPLPQITSVTPNPTPPNRDVAVTGTTGPCQEGTLTLPIPQPGQDDVEVAVTAGRDGRFEAPLKVPGGTFVGTHTLQLRVDCDGRERVAQATLEVRNQPPDAVDDRAQTAKGRSVTIDVTGNDTDPDGDDGYRTSLEVGRPAKGTAERQGERVLYTPDDGATGEDQFSYRLCDVVDAGGGTDCGNATVTVTVTDPAGPVISSVEPGSTPPGRGVEVAGNTGACGRDGTLALQGTSASAIVAGDQDGAFTASLTVPAGTFPKPYRLELRVDCRGQPQRAEAELVVTNQAPEAADDAESTARDQAVRIRVADNDRDPDDPDGYRTRVLVTDPPDRGTAQEQPDLTVVYTPAPGVIGEDQFTYSLCDDVLDAAGRANCGAATVTVNVTDVPVISSVEPAATSPGRPVKVVGNTGSCDQAGTLTFRGETDLRADVTGDRNGGFTADFTVPERTFPGARRLELVVDCGGQLQRAEAELTVVNQAPVAADDQATTSPDVSTTIDVTRNDRDPDDPDTYPTLLLVTDPPDHGTAEVRSDLSVVYTPEPGFADEDQFVYSLCDDLLNPAGQPDCGTATVTVRVDPIACAPPVGQDARLRAEPDRGRGGTRLHITAAVDPRLATCQFRLLLGGTPLGPDVSVGDDGSISADRDVPSDAKPGPSPVRLATLTAETLDEIPFEVTRGWWPPWPPWLPRLLLSAGLLVAGFLARAVYKRLARPDERPDRRPVADPPNDLRAEPHTRPVEATVEPVNDNTRTVAVRLEPHPDAGVQSVETLEEVTRWPPPPTPVR
jgi:large repetitive protein